MALGNSGHSEDIPSLRSTTNLQQKPAHIDSGFEAAFKLCQKKRLARFYIGM